MPLPLETERLIIRSFTPDDAEAMFKVLGDAETMRFFLIWLAKSVENARGFIGWVTGMERDFGYSFWAVVEKTSGEVIGDCGLAPLEGEGPEVELGCDLRKDKWNQGYATEAGIACLEYGFRELKLDRIVAVTNPQNFAAQRALEKLGFTEEGRGEHYGGESVEYAKYREKG
ncbi:MAG TPA: GNAT family N-acetyltransferase [bacterium]|jgi:RimJ/RimL family protein N-acetyltransferase